MDMESLRSKYPQYFDLNTSKGLEVYVWQMAQGSYICGVLPGTNREKSIEELMNLQGVTIGKMRAILSAYDIEKEDVIHVSFCFSVRYQDYSKVSDALVIICYWLQSVVEISRLLLPKCYQSVTKIFQRVKR
jgi:hypothetical protein